MRFEIVGEVAAIQVIAAGGKLRRRKELCERYGKGRWRRKVKGIAKVRLATDTLRIAEIHWYEAHGIGRRAFKIKRFLD